MRLQYMSEEPINADVLWEENLYHAAVIVRGGYVEVDEETQPLAVEALLVRGYRVVEEAEIKTASRKKQDNKGGAGDKGADE